MVRLFFPPKTLEKMKAMGIAEADIEDVFNKGQHGVSKGNKMAIRKYNGYEIGIFYVMATFGPYDYAVVAVWKRERG
ncbi:hypothetical protein M1116_04010 [Patescibacteria group bacterium]|nr:hypothetical protein [Patescibacteria group bacterium]